MSDHLAATPRTDDPPYRADDPPGRSDQSRRRASLKAAVEWAAIIVGAFVVALLVKAFLLQAFFIPSPSMEPTLAVGDRVLVNKLAYRWSDIDRGDLIVFRRPPNEPASEVNDLIKRVIGLPGETVEVRDGVVYIDGSALREPYLAPGTTTSGLDLQTIPAGHYLVLGDNRADSRDGRRFGPISEDLVVGRAFVRIWPLSASGRL